ncbi:MAG: glycosyltransferase, partial [Waddliaceae bacterium]
MLKERETNFVRDTSPILDKGPYDIIHCQFGVLGAEFVELKELASLKSRLVVSFRGYDISKFVSTHGAAVYDPLFKRGDCFLPNCDSFKRRLLALGCDPSKITVLRSGIDCDKFTFAPRESASNSTRFVTIGRLVEKKGIEYGIRAVTKLVKTGKNVHYSIIGDGPLKSHLKALIGELGLHQQIEIFQEKNREEIIEILNRSHALIAPSITDDAGNQEGIPNVLKEAMAMGLPVVSTYHSGIPELIDDGISGFLVPERDTESLAQKLNTLIDRPETWLPMGKAGRARVEKHYHAKKLNLELVEIYNSFFTPRRLPSIS